MYQTYILRCTDQTLYTGITTDLTRRMQEHFSGNEKCAKYTFRHVAKKLECAWETENRILASKLEYHIKKLSKIKKEEYTLNYQELYHILFQLIKDFLYIAELSYSFEFELPNIHPTKEELEKIKEYCINPVDSRETDEIKPDTLLQEFGEPEDIKVFEGFQDMPEQELSVLYNSLGLAMTFQDFLHIQNYFKKE